MNNDFAEIWQSQSTTGAKISLEEVRKRVQRSKTRTKRTGIIAVTAGISNLLLMVITDVFFFESPVGAWLRAAQLVTWIVVCRYIGASGFATRGRILTLNLGGRSKPCLNFYRQQLQTLHNSLRQGRGVTFIAGIGGALFIVLSSVFPSFGKHPGVLMSLGLVLMIGGFLWYLLLRREAPRIQTELDELEGLSETASNAKR